MPRSPGKFPDVSSSGTVPCAIPGGDSQREDLLPYGRDEKLARPWIKPGTPGLMHRIGGIEKAVDTGHIDYAPANHQTMTEIRRDKVLGVADSIADQEVALGYKEGGKLAVVGWGSTFGPIHQAVRKAIECRQGCCPYSHIRNIWPMPKNHE